MAKQNYRSETMPERIQRMHYLYDNGPKPKHLDNSCLLYTSPSPRDRQKSRMPSSA